MRKKPPKEPKVEGLTQLEVATRSGCSQSTISRAIARGDIEVLPSGRVPESAVEIMRAQRAQEAAANEATSDLERRLLAAQAAEREAKAKLRQLELERESGRFVELDLVERDAADTAERILGVLRAIPQRTALALECPCNRAAIVEAKIREEVERAIAELAESKFGAPS